MNKADSTFLSVALVCKKLLNVYVTRRNILSTLNSLPPGLIGLYKRMMEQVLQNEDETNRHFCIKILLSASLAFRPLSMDELMIIAEFPPDFQNEDISDLVDLCGSFITIRENILYFVHQSAKDYLVDSGPQMFL
jgi:hypothetical protein